MKNFHLLPFIAAFLFTGCVSDDLGDFGDNHQEKVPLSLDFGIAQPEEASSRVVKNSFSGSDYIGLSLRSAAGTASYDGKAFENIKYGATSKTAVTTSQTPQLSANTGYVYAYYPYADGTNITSISMTAANAQTDYMYGSAGNAATSAFSAVSCNDHDNGKAMYMHHAKALFEFTIKRGTYTGTGKINTITASGTLTNTGTLNATTGAVTAGGSNVAVSVNPSLTIGSTSGNSITSNMLVVSRNTSSNQTVTISVDVDGKTYTTSCSILVKPQYKNSITLTLNNVNLSVSDLSISGWGTYTSSSSMNMNVGGFNVTIGGLSDKIALANINVSNGTITFKALPTKGGYQVKAPTLSTTYSSYSTSVESNNPPFGVRTVILKPNKAITITFNGYDNVLNGVEFIPTGVESGAISGGHIGFARYNLGATDMGEPGYYFVYGETAPYARGYDSQNHKIEYYKSATQDNMRRNIKLEQFSLYKDGTATTGSHYRLPDEFDPACAMLGKGWRMPYSTELYRLVDDFQDTPDDTYNNSNTYLLEYNIVLPCAGYVKDKTRMHHNTMGFYRIKDSFWQYNYEEQDALCFTWGSWDYALEGYWPNDAMSIRPVCELP